MYATLKHYTILIAEDEPRPLDYLSSIFKRYFRKVLTASDGEEAFAKVLSETVDVILTDMRMPRQDGVEFVLKLRKMGIQTPVIFMSAHSDADTLLRVIPLSVCHYLIKPVETEAILELCVEALNKRPPVSVPAAPSVRYTLTSGITVDLADNTVSRSGRLIELTKKELDLLSLFVLNPRAVLTKEKIEYALWNAETVSESSVKTLIKKLRAKIGEEAIVTVKNVGYRLCETVK